MNLKSHLVDMPIEAYPFLHYPRITEDGVIVADMIVPRTKQLERIMATAYHLSPFKAKLRKVIKQPGFKDRYELPFTSGMNKGLNCIDADELIKKIKTNNIFIPDDVKDYICLALDVKRHLFDLPTEHRFESIRQMLVMLRAQLKEVYWIENRDHLMLIEGIFQAIRGFICSAWKIIPQRLIRWFNNKLPFLIADDPHRMLKEAKDWAHFCDRTFFNIRFQKCPESFLVFLPFMDEKRFAWGHYITRCLPHGEPPKIESYVERVSVSNPIHEDSLNSFSEFIQDWADVHSSEDLPDPTFKPTNRSSIETTRRSGGQAGLYDTLIKYQHIRIRLGYTSIPDQWCSESPLTDMVTHMDEMAFAEEDWCNCMNDKQEYCHLHSWASKSKVPFLKKSLTNHKLPPPEITSQKDWTLANGRFRLLVAACWNLIKLFPDNPILILVLKERGGKFRLPTKSLIGVQVLGGLLRSRVNNLMTRDSRIRGSLTSSEFKILDQSYNRLYRSQDLSFATDMYEFSTIRTLYISLEKKGVFKGLPFFWDYINWIYPDHGRNIYVVGDLVGCFSFQFKLDISVVDSFWNDLFSSMSKIMIRAGITPALPEFPTMKKFISLNKRKSHIYSPQEVYALSLLVRRFEAEYREFLSNRTFFKLVGVQKRGPCMGEPLSWPILPLVTIYGYDTTHHHKGDLITCGDDAVFKTDRVRNEMYNQRILSLGASINWSKDSLHPSKYIFVERLFDAGKPVGVMPFAPGFAVPSMKQEQTYYTVCPSLINLGKLHRTSYSIVRRIARRSRFTGEISLFNEKIPIRNFPHELGGVSYPNSDINMSWLRIIASYANNYTNDDLLRGKSLLWSRRILQPVRLNSDFLRELLLMQGPNPENYQWTLDKAWELKSQSVYGLAALTGSMPLSMDLRRPGILNRVWEIKSTLSKSERLSGPVSLNGTREKMKDGLNPIIHCFRPVLGDSFPLQIITNYDVLHENRNFVVQLSKRDDDIVLNYDAYGCAVPIADYDL